MPVEGQRRHKPWISRRLRPPSLRRGPTSDDSRSAPSPSSSLPIRTGSPAPVAQRVGGDHAFVL